MDTKSILGALSVIAALLQHTSGSLGPKSEDREQGREERERQRTVSKRNDSSKAAEDR